MARNQKKMRILSEKEEQDLVSAINNRRDEKLVKFTLNHGLRNSEAVSLKRKHVDLDNWTLWVEDGKRSKDRSIGINIGIRDEVKNYIEELDREDYLFPSPITNSHISTRHFQTMIRRNAIEAGLYKKHEKVVRKPIDVTQKIPYKERVTPHTLRHTFSVRLLRNNTPIQEVSKMLGHEKVDITIESYDVYDVEVGRKYLDDTFG